MEKFDRRLKSTESRLLFLMMLDMVWDLKPLSRRLRIKEGRYLRIVLCDFYIKYVQSSSVHGTCQTLQ